MTWQWYLKCWKLNKTAFLNSSINSSCSDCSFLSPIGRKLRVTFLQHMSATDPLVMSHVIEDVLDRFTPTIPLRITYNNRLLLSSAELKPSAVVSKPRVEIGGNDMRAFYTLVLIDPDAPSPSHPSLREYLHWMVTDIPETTSVNFGQELMPYERPDPRSGIHRLVFVLFRQLGRGTVFAPEIRHNFNCRSFARQYHLSIAAATYFNCQREGGSGGRRFREE